jgi:hypothetical protein
MNNAYKDYTGQARFYTVIASSEIRHAVIALVEDSNAPQPVPGVLRNIALSKAPHYVGHTFSSIRRALRQWWRRYDNQQQRR